MTNILGKIWKEYIMGISIALLIIGLIVLIFGILGTLSSDMLTDMLRIHPDVLDWSLYILIIGAILTFSGGYYLYDFLRNKRFLLDKIETNKRSEFMKYHAQLKNAVRKLPSKYQEMLHKKEKQLRLK